MLEWKDLRIQYMIYTKISLKYATETMQGVDTLSKWQSLNFLYSTY